MTQNERNMLLDYEEILMTNSSKKISPNYLQQENGEEMAKLLFRYAIEKVLRWRPEDVYNYMTPALIRSLHLVLPYSKLEFPEELVKKRDTFYVAAILYPNQVVTNRRSLVLIHYRYALEQRGTKLPEDFFSGNAGELRAHICLQYVLLLLQQRDMLFETVEDMYFFFSDEKRADGLLQQYKLLAARQELYETPLDYLHEVLPEVQKDTLLYQYYKFVRVYRGSKYQKQIKKLCEVKETASM